MTSQNNNNNTSNNSNDMYEDMELFEEDIKESNKRARDEEDDEEPESKRQREDEESEDDDIWRRISSETENSVSDEGEESDSVSDEGEESETDRINTKYSKRFSAIEDYKEKNELLSEMSIQDVMSKLDRGEIISEQEFETLKRANRLMDQDVIKDKDSIERMQLYEDFSASVQKEISDNNAEIERHEEKISEYLARLDELNKENNETSSDNASSDSSNVSNSDNPSNSSGPDDVDDDDRFDDFPPSFDFDDF
jgi:hypothetical protein